MKDKTHLIGIVLFAIAIAAWFFGNKESSENLEASSSNIIINSKTDNRPQNKSSASGQKSDQAFATPQGFNPHGPPVPLDDGLRAEFEEKKLELQKEYLSVHLRMARKEWTAEEYHRWLEQWDQTHGHLLQHFQREIAAPTKQQQSGFRILKESLPKQAVPDTKESRAMQSELAQLTQKLDSSMQRMKQSVDLTDAHAYQGALEKWTEENKGLVQQKYELTSQLSKLSQPKEKFYPIETVELSPYADELDQGFKIAYEDRASFMRELKQVADEEGEITADNWHALLEVNEAKIQELNAKVGEWQHKIKLRDLEAAAQALGL